MIGKYKSLKNKKRANRSRHQGNTGGRTYRHPVQTNMKGDRFVQIGARKFLLSVDNGHR